MTTIVLVNFSCDDDATLFFCLFHLAEFFAFFQYDLTLVASDSLNENETTVVMRIIDKNDLPPVFSQSVYMAEILEEFTSNLPLKLTQVFFWFG